MDTEAGTSPITINEAKLKTFSVQVKALTINDKQMTLAVFRQLDAEDVIDESGKLKGLPWGRVNYAPSDCDREHKHIVWQKNELLRRACLFGSHAETADRVSPLQHRAEIFAETGALLESLDEKPVELTSELLRTAYWKMSLERVRLRHSFSFEESIKRLWMSETERDKFIKGSFSDYQRKQYDILEIKKKILDVIRTNWDGDNEPLPSKESCRTRYDQLQDNIKGTRKNLKESFSVLDALDLLFIAV